MQIEIKDILPVLGIILGWWLSELSKVIRERSEDKRLINRTVAELLFLRYEIYQFNCFAKGSIDAYGSGKTAEQQRRRIMNKHLVSIDAISHSYDELFNKIASYDPILAKEVIHKTLSFRKLRDLEFNEVSKNSNAYEAILLTVVETLEALIDYIEKATIKLSFKSSITLWIRIRREFEKDNNDIGNWGKSTKGIMDFIEEMDDDKKMSQ